MQRRTTLIRRSVTLRVSGCYIDGAALRSDNDTAQLLIFVNSTLRSRHNTTLNQRLHTFDHDDQFEVFDGSDRSNHIARRKMSINMYMFGQHENKCGSRCWWNDSCVGVARTRGRMCTPWSWKKKRKGNVSELRCPMNISTNWRAYNLEVINCYMF